jgi:hypothetical protein
MAKRRARGSARSVRRNVNGANRRDILAGMDASVIPRVLLGAVDGVGIVAVGALQFARDVLLTAVSGAANIGAEAVTATVTGTRGVVAATAQLVGDIAGTAQGSFLATINNARRPRRASLELGRPPGAVNEETAEKGTSSRASRASRARRRARTSRPVPRLSRPSVAA